MLSILDCCDSLADDGLTTAFQVQVSSSGWLNQNCSTFFQMFCLALTLLSATLLAADYKVYEITETKEGFAGLYLKTSRPSLSFQRIGGKENNRFYHLFRRSALSSEWKIGYAKNNENKGKTISFKAKPVLPLQCLRSKFYPRPYIRSLVGK